MSSTTPCRVLVGERVHLDPGLQAGLDPVDHRLVDLGVDPHPADVGQAEDLLTLADGRPFLDLGLRAAAEPVRVVGVDDQAVVGGEDLAVLDLFVELRFLGLLQIPGRLLGQLVGTGLLDLGS